MAVYKEKWGLPTSPTTPIYWLNYNMDTANMQVIRRFHQAGSPSTEMNSRLGSVSLCFVARARLCYNHTCSLGGAPDTLKVI